MGYRDDSAVAFRYRASLGKLTMAVLFFGATAWWLAVTAAHNDRGLLINRIIPLSVDQATTAYAALATLAGGFTALALVGIFLALFVDRRVVVSADGIVAPRGRFSIRHVDIPLSAVIRVHVEQFQHGRRLAIDHTAGKLTIDESMLNGAGDFEELCGAVAEHIRDERRGRQRRAA
jgi:hypothetical protein